MVVAILKRRSVKKRLVVAMFKRPILLLRIDVCNIKHQFVAIERLNSKYAIPYEADGRKVTKCGVCISSDQRNITQWRITDADGNVIEENDLSVVFS